MASLTQPTQPTQSTQLTPLTSQNFDQFKLGPLLPFFRSIRDKIFVFVYNADHVLLSLVGTSLTSKINLTQFPQFKELCSLYQFINKCPEKDVYFDEKSSILTFIFNSDHGISLSFPIYLRTLSSLDSIELFSMNGWTKVGMLENIFDLFGKYPRESFQYAVF
jgi:hypothetical protein